MAYNYGLTGIAIINSAGWVGSGSVRVFDVMLVNVTNGGTITLRNGVKVAGFSDTTTGGQYVTVSSGLSSFNSNAGIRFADGCLAVASAGTGVVNYITEY
jgi:hypothetical protein